MADLKVQKNVLLADQGSSYKVTKTIGIQEGVGASVSGLGATAHVKGKGATSARRIEQSKTYNELHKKYNFSSGVNGFWAFITGKHKGTQISREEIDKVFHETQQVTDTAVTYHFDLDVTGYAPNVQVDARAYYTRLQVEDTQGNTFDIISADGEGAKNDTGATNKNSDAPNQQPGLKGNNTTVSF